MTTTGQTRIRLTDLRPTAADFRAEFLAGLELTPKRLPSKFFYDDRGSRLFDRICDLPEYYPTRTERAILAARAAEIRRFCGPGCRLVELGSGSSAKTRNLFDTLDRPVAYVPVDIARGHLRRAAAAVAEEYPDLEVLPVCADYTQPLELPLPDRGTGRTVIFFPGSSIGNFEPEEAAAFLGRIARWTDPGDRLLVGIDLEKDRAVLERAYNDAAGVTAAFNLNLLVRANEELGARFVIERFRHQAIYDAIRQRIEMHLVSAGDQEVPIERVYVRLAAGERIVTEHSYKYRPEQFARLADAEGWSRRECWTDARGWFAVLGLERR